MKNISLKWKIVFIAFLPFLCFALVSLYQMNDILNVYQDASQVSKKVLLYSKASPLIHQMQIERGMSFAFSSGAIDAAKLRQQWEATDIKINDYKNVLFLANLPENLRQELEASLKEHSAIRELVLGKNIADPLIMEKYKAFITRLIKIGLDSANDTNLTKIAIGLKSHAALEEVKDNTGLLRAQMNKVLANNKGITSDISDGILILKSSVDSTLISRTLVLDAKATELLENFQRSGEWTEITRALKVILKNGNQGNFGINPNDFFAEATVAVNKLGALIDYQTNFLLNEVQETHAQSEKKLWYMGGSLLLITILLSVIVFQMVSNINKSLRTVASNLLVGSKHVATASYDIEKSAVILSEASNEQASSLQQTSAAIDEINAMVGKNSDAAQNSKNESAKSQKASARGKQTVEEMLESIQEIGRSNREIMEQMEESNKEFSEIATVIATIGERTKVINEIVFQTKLLSFNASVEAARAGEHGQGFSVVADEIGNLASMSGKAATEISSILDQSISKVGNIITNNQSRIKVLVETGKEKLSIGIKTAEKCDMVLDEILENVSKVDSMVMEIATASKEQSKGVQEITSAMSQLDQANQQNTNISQNSSVAATELSKQALELEHVASELVALIEGSSMETVA